MAEVHRQQGRNRPGRRGRYIDRARRKRCADEGTDAEADDASA